LRVTILEKRIAFESRGFLKGGIKRAVECIKIKIRLTQNTGRLPLSEAVRRWHSSRKQLIYQNNSCHGADI